jgi:hypothetical protein
MTDYCGLCRWSKCYHNLSKQIPVTPAHQDLSNNTKGTFQILLNFQLRFNLILSEEIIQYSRTFARFNLMLSEGIIQYSRTFAPQV